MSLRHAPHAVYDCQYHLVWTPKYRKAVLSGAVGLRMEALLRAISAAYDVEVAEIHVADDHVHLFCSFPPRDSISVVIGRLKSLSARAIFREFPELRRHLWGGEFWGAGYFARTVGDRLTAAVILRYIQNHRLEEAGPEDDGQLSLF